MSIYTRSEKYHIKFTGKLVSPDGVIRHFINGAYGREGDLPSVIHPDGSQFWYKENPKRGSIGQQSAIPHREGDLPAVIRANGDQLFYVDGKLNRENDQPAVVLVEGVLKWFEKGDCYAYKFGDNPRVTKDKKATPTPAASLQTINIPQE